MSSKPWVYEEDGRVFYRAYSLGNCLVGLVASRLGETETPLNANFRVHIDRSASLEEPLLAQVAAATNDELIWQQKEVDLSVAVSFDVPGGIDNRVVTVRGHIDALRQSRDCIIEAKALGTNLFEKWNSGGIDALGMLGLKYKWQGAIYGHATGRQVQFAIGLKHVNDDGTVSIEDLILEPPVDAESLVPLSDIVARIQKVEEHAYLDSYPDCDRNCRPNDSFSHVHQFAPVARADATLEDLIATDQSLDARISELQDERDLIRDTVKASYAIGKYTAGPYKLHLIQMEPNRFDTSGHKKHNPECHEAYMKPGAPFVQMRVVDSRKKSEEKKDG